MDEILCDVVPMDACHVLLGRPWQYDRDVVHRGRVNEYELEHNGKKIVLKPMASHEVRSMVVRQGKRFNLTLFATELDEKQDVADGGLFSKDDSKFERVFDPTKPPIFDDELEEIFGSFDKEMKQKRNVHEEDAKIFQDVFCPSEIDAVEIYENHKLLWKYAKKVVIQILEQKSESGAEQILFIFANKGNFKSEESRVFDPGIC